MRSVLRVRCLPHFPRALPLSVRFLWRKILLWKWFDRLSRQFKVHEVLGCLYTFRVEVYQQRLWLLVFLHCPRRIRAAWGLRLCFLGPSNLLNYHLNFLARVFLGRNASEKGLLHRRRILRRLRADLDLGRIRAKAVFLCKGLVCRRQSDLLRFLRDRGLFPSLGEYLANFYWQLGRLHSFALLAVRLRLRRCCGLPLHFILTNNFAFFN